jgi:hypothetical protein
MLTAASRANKQGPDRRGRGIASRGRRSLPSPPAHCTRNVPTRTFLQPAPVGQRRVKVKLAGCGHAPRLCLCCFIHSLSMAQHPQVGEARGRRLGQRQGAVLTCKHKPVHTCIQQQRGSEQQEGGPPHGLLNRTSWIALGVAIARAGASRSHLWQYQQRGGSAVHGVFKVTPDIQNPPSQHGMCGAPSLPSASSPLHAPCVGCGVLCAVLFVLYDV